MRHTPGPWRVLDGAILSKDINKYGNWTIVDCQRERTEEDETNLRLIATAPELLEACKEVLDIINSYSHIQAMFKACENLQAIIAKAEGKD